MLSQLLERRGSDLATMYYVIVLATLRTEIRSVSSKAVFKLRALKLKVAPSLVHAVVELLKGYGRAPHRDYVYSYISANLALLFNLKIIRNWSMSAQPSFVLGRG